MRVRVIVYRTIVQVWSLVSCVCSLCTCYVALGVISASRYIKITDNRSAANEATRSALSSVLSVPRSLTAHTAVACTHTSRPMISI